VKEDVTQASQAIMDAILAGKRIEPFATFNEQFHKWAQKINATVGAALVEMLCEPQGIEEET